MVVVEEKIKTHFRFNNFF